MGSRIHDLRKAKHLSQEELGKLLYTTKTAVSNWERGVFIPDLDIMVRLCNTFDVSLDYIAGISDFKNTAKEKISKQKAEEVAKGNLVITDVENLTDTEKNQILTFADFLKEKHQKTKTD